MSRKPVRQALVLLLSGAALAVIVVAGIRLFRQSASPAGAEPTPVRLAYQDRIGSALCIVAVEKNFFQEAGVPVQAFRFNNGPACAEALFSGSADLATMGDTTAIIAVARDLPVSIIASHGSGEHRHRLVVAGNSPISGTDQLAGKTVGVKKGTSTYGGFLAFLAANRIPVNNIHLIDMRPEEMPEALLAGSIDAFVASEPTPSLAELRGARQLSTLGGLGNNYPVMILAGNQLLERRPDMVRNLLAALQRAELFMRENPKETATILARVTGLPGDLVERSMALHEYRLALDEPVLASLEDTAEFLRSQGIIDRLPDLRRAADAGYVP
jgi:ABC-type nitrate/sulfonate/bicarbonate transport system substrate-binding protein